MRRSGRRSGRLGRASEVLMVLVLTGCVGSLPPLPPVPRDPVDRLRASVEGMTERPEVVDLPPPIVGPPPIELACSQAAEDPSLWLCVGDPGRMGDGRGLFFAYEGGSAETLSKLLASERLLRELVQVLRARVDVRDRMLLAQLDLLDTTLAMADEYRMIAVIRGDEITRLQRDRVIDRLTLMVPIFGAVAGGIYFLAR